MGYGFLFSTALVVGLTGAMMPGSLLVVAIGESARRGWIAGPLLVAGHAVLELLLVLLLAAGLSAFLAQGAVAGFIGLLGGLVLAWMGYNVAKSACLGQVSLKSLDRAGDAAAASSGLQHKAWWVPVAGVVATVSNPYWLLWWATIGAGYIVLALERGTLGLSMFYLGHISADFLWYSLVAVVVSTGRRFISDRIYQGVLLVCGLFLIGLAGYFVYSGWGMLVTA
ncbi:MAG: LysE family transporter [Bacillota bacterium]